MKSEELFSKILTDIQNSKTGRTGRKAKTIFSFLGAKTTNSQKAIDAFNLGLKHYNLKTTDNEVYYGMSYKNWITFELKGLGTKKRQIPVSKVIPSMEDSPEPAFKIPDDFLRYLFEFESDPEYERFQASLDSKFPVAIFLIPKKDDFYSSIVERVLSFEIIRKRQYEGDGGSIIGNTNQQDFSKRNDDPSQDLNFEGNMLNIWTKSDIHNFTQETMNNVILGESGKELIESEKFDRQFNQLALYSNKYYSNDQFFILFNCPSIEKINQQKRMHNLDKIVDKVTQKLPYTFRLQCKFSNDSELVDNPNIRKEIINHFKILCEIPSYQATEETGERDDIFNVFVEFQKAQMQAESQLIHKFDPALFSKLTWGYESDEHKYLKYFALKTLHEQFRYSLNSIFSETNETSFDEITKEDYSSRPDVKAENPILGNIIVEAETMRGKSYLTMIREITNKGKGWTKDKYLKEVWLVLPGFEVARNYYQLQTAQHLIKTNLFEIFGNEIMVKVFAPDYFSQRIIEVDLSHTYTSTYQILSKGRQKRSENVKPIFEGFKKVKGLKDEKARLFELKNLYEGQFNLGIGGILFYGLPGCGKTYLAKSFAEEMGWNFFAFSPADLISVWIGESQKNIQSIFNQAKAKNPAILFIDELDSIAFSRDNNSDGSVHSDQKATINQLLIEINNIAEHNVLVIGATNFIKALDPAIRRSGRFDLKIPIFPPNKDERKEILQYYVANLNEELKCREIKERLTITDAEFDLLADKTKRFTSSDLKTLLNTPRIDLILNKPNSSSVEKLLMEIDDFENTGQRSLQDFQVEAFINECQENRINSQKLVDLKREWGITANKIGY
jgi:SpoVK/Ycf46/Vps4 family AAA+-type ATPase